MSESRGPIRRIGLDSMRAEIKPIGEIYFYAQQHFIAFAIFPGILVLRLGF